jgi:hypothetical protein
MGPRTSFGRHSQGKGGAIVKYIYECGQAVKSGDKIILWSLARFSNRKKAEAAISDWLKRGHTVKGPTKLEVH